MSPGVEDRPEPDEEDDGSWINKEFLEGVLGAGSSVIKVDAQRAVAKGENFLSLLYRTRVEFQPAGSDEVKVLQLVVKGLPNGEFMQVFVEELAVFSRETKIYEETLPRLYDFADAKVGKNCFKRFTAHYYQSTRADTLILEDLKQHNFTMADRRNRLDFKHAKLVIENLARLHALSVAYNETHPGYISQFYDRMFSEVNRERLTQYIPLQVQAIREEITKWKGFEKIASKLEVLETTCIDKLIDTCKLVEGGRNVLIHGDCWVNNILFNYSESGELQELRFVDFQLTREASPALDLHYFIFSSMSTAVRVQHFNDFLEIYCETFQNWAKKLGFTGPIITIEEIRQEMDRTLFFGFTSVLTTMAIVLADPDDSPDLSTLTTDDIEKGEVRLFDKIYASNAFREAFENLLPFFDEKGVLD